MRTKTVPFVFEDPDPPGAPVRLRVWTTRRARTPVSGAADSRIILPRLDENQDRDQSIAMLRDHCGPMVRPGGQPWSI